MGEFDYIATSLVAVFFAKLLCSSPSSTSWLEVLFTIDYPECHARKMPHLVALCTVPLVGGTALGHIDPYYRLIWRASFFLNQVSSLTQIPSKYPTGGPCTSLILFLSNHQISVRLPEVQVFVGAR